MKRILSPALLLLLPLTSAGAFSASQDDSEKTPRESESAEANPGQQAQSPKLKAVEFATNHGNLQYTIFDHRRTIGEYVQKTKLTTIKSGQEVLDMVDYYRFFKNEEARTKRTRTLINKHFDIVEFTGESGKMGTIGLKVRNGVLTGRTLDGGMLQLTPPDHMATRDMMQRGLYELPSVIGESTSMPVIALENLGQQELCTEVTITFKGMEETSAQGVTYNCRKYVVRAAGEKRASHYWFGPENRMIKLRTGLQTWELMSKGQREPIAVKRMPNPNRQRKQENQEEGEDDDLDEEDGDGEDGE